MQMDRKGIVYALGAYVLWGLFPIYWKWLGAVPAPQLLGHRVAWSFLFVAGLLAAVGQWRAFLAQTVRWRVVGVYLVAALLIGANWLLYVWAVNADYIIETSLGYFINPLVSVMLGVVFLRERLRPLQWIPVALAAVGVAYLTWLYGRLPWIALTLAFSFGAYGLVKKLSPLPSLPGLAMETGILFPFAVIYLFAMEALGMGAFAHLGLQADLLMIGAGVVTTVPLLFFASATQRIPLAMIGLMQYFAPTIQLLLGVWVFHEPFSVAQLAGFSVVWVGLAIFVLEGWFAGRRRPIFAQAQSD